MLEKLVGFLRKKSNSLIEEIAFSIKNLEQTRYRFHPIEDIWESSYQLFQDGLIYLQTNNSKPILNSIQELAKRRVKDGFQIFETPLAFLTAKEIIRRKLVHEFGTNPSLLEDYIKVNEGIGKILVVNYVESFHYHSRSLDNYNSSYRFPVWTGERIDSKLIE